MIALNSDKPIEEMFSEFINNKVDNLDPEDLDLLNLSNNNENIIFNPIQKQICLFLKIFLIIIIKVIFNIASF